MAERIIEGITEDSTKRFVIDDATGKVYRVELDGRGEERSRLELPGHAAENIRLADLRNRVRAGHTPTREEIDAQVIRQIRDGR